MSARPRVWPRPLVRGDLVMVVAPSGPVDPVRLQQGAAIIASWGLTVRYGSSVLDHHDQLSYLAGDDRLRAADFTSGWSDPETAAVWAARGGYGAQRMVDLLDFDVPRPIRLCTAVASEKPTRCRELGQVTVHGPGVGSVDQLSDSGNVAALRQLIMGSPALRRSWWRAGRCSRAQPTVGSGAAISLCWPAMSASSRSRMSR